jgi:hypothetical protein|tara:strand:- start:8727 stop:9059 length:333 start_codon:yes stop_codon:yes gene_type:complete
MKVAEIKEGVIGIWGKNKGKLVRKYRCTSGTRKGRIVAKPATCNATKRVSSALNIKRAKAKKASVMQVRSSRTKRASGLSKRVAGANKPQSQARYKKPTRRKSFKKRSKK